MKNEDRFVFNKGETEIRLSQQDMARAVEFWLNAKFVKVPIKVSRMVESKTNFHATFAVYLVEDPELEEEIEQNEPVART